MAPQPSLWQRTSRPTKLFLFYAAMLLVTTGAMLVVWRDYDKHPDEWTRKAHDGHIDAAQRVSCTINKFSTLDTTGGRAVEEQHWRRDVEVEKRKTCEDCINQMRKCVHDCHKDVIQCNWECVCEVLKRDKFCREQCRFKCGSGWRA